MSGAHLHSLVKWLGVNGQWLGVDQISHEAHANADPIPLMRQSRRLRKPWDGYLHGDGVPRRHPDVLTTPPSLLLGS